MVSVSSRSNVFRTGKMLMLVDPLPLRFVARTRRLQFFCSGCILEYFGGNVSCPGWTFICRWQEAQEMIGMAWNPACHTPHGDIFCSLNKICECKEGGVS